MVSLATDTVGAADMVTLPVSVPVPQFPRVYTTVYVVLDAGLTVIDCVVSVPGDHLYVPPVCDGVAVRVAGMPGHTVVSFTETVGGNNTVTVA